MGESSLQPTLHTQLSLSFFDNLRPSGQDTPQAGQTPRSYQAPSPVHPHTQ